MLRCLRVTTVIVSTIAATACASATMNVSSHVERGLDFAQYRSYDWGPADALPTGDPRLDKDPFFHDHMQGAVEKQLASKGFERVTTGSPDLLIHYHTSIDERIDVGQVDREAGSCAEPYCGGLAYYEMGTLVIDIVDARTNRLVWRGWAQDAMNDVLTNRDLMTLRINESVSRMFERLPRQASRSVSRSASRTRFAH